MDSHVSLLLAAGLVAAASIPLIMRIVPPNAIYGFKTRRTMADESLWFRANFFAGWALLTASIISAILLAAIPGQDLPRLLSVLFLAGPMLAAVLASFVYLWSIDGAARS